MDKKSQKSQIEECFIQNFILKLKSITEPIEKIEKIEIKEKSHIDIFNEEREVKHVLNSLKCKRMEIFR